MRLSRLASSLLALSLLSGAAVAAPGFAQPPPSAPADKAELIVPPSTTVSRAQVKAALAQRRAQTLALFRTYRRAGVYPHNFVTADKLNVWLDDEGRLCAAATIIANSGHRDLVMRVAKDDNFIRLGDVRSGELMDWILTSGLTQEEIAAIQEPFMGMQEPNNGEPVPEPRIAEYQRLRQRYAQVDRQIVKNKARSLDLAVDRLMAHPELAKSIVTML